MVHNCSQQGTRGKLGEGALEAYAPLHLAVPN